MRGRLDRLGGLPIRPATARRLALGLGPGPGPGDPAFDPGWALLVATRGEAEARRLLPGWPWWGPCGGRGGEARDRLWRRSVASALAARCLVGSADGPDADPDAAVRAALLHPIALWALADVDPDALADWLDAESPARRLALERSWFGRDLASAGLLLAHRWGCGPGLIALFQSADQPTPGRPPAPIRLAHDWADQTPWASPGRPDAGASGPDELRRRWLVAAVQARTAGGLAGLDEPEGTDDALLREALRLRDRVHRLESGLADLWTVPAPPTIPAPPEPPSRPPAEVLDAMAEFAGGAAHELNNPLAIIAGRAQLLRAAQRDPDQRKALQTIIDQARRAHQILRDLIYIARPPAPRQVPCLPDQVLRSVVDDLASEAARRQVRLAFRPCRKAETIPVLSDPDALRHLADALVRNALEATGPGGEVVVEPIDAPRSVAWIVRDTGIGLDEERAAHLLDPFYCGRQAGRGLGLGLSRASRYVRVVGGSIRWESSPGRGTAVRVELPLEANSERPAAESGRPGLRDAG